MRRLWPEREVTGDPRRAAVRRAAIVVTLLALWETATRLGGVSPLLFPPASTVLASFARSHLFFRWIERKTVLGWGMSASH